MIIKDDKASNLKYGNPKFLKFKYMKTFNCKNVITYNKKFI